MVLAVVAGLGAVLLAARWMQRQGGERTHIAVASTEIAMGSRLAPELVRVVDWPQSSVPPGAIKDGAALSGRVVTVALHPGEPVLESRLAPVGAKGGLSAVVPMGKRAMTVRVNDVVAVAGFALPGTYVDILVNTMEEGSGRSNDKDRSVSKIVLEHILVLAVAQESDRDETKPRVVNAVTLEVTPQQAEVLDLARSVGTLSLVLRNQADPDPAETAGATKAVLLGESPVPASTPAAPASAAAPKAAAAPKPVRRVVARAAAPAPAPAPVVPASTNCVEIIRGTVKTTECF